MKRKLFFYLEKLEINRSERIAVSFLLIIMFILSGTVYILEPKANYSEEEYAELEKIFKEKSEKIEREEEILLARYHPDQEVEESTPIEMDKNRLSAKQDTTEKENRSEPTEDAEMININRASITRLQELPGVGPAYASRIISWREENGPFTSKEQLIEINGIGEKRLARIKPLITLE